MRIATTHALMCVLLGIGLTAPATSVRAQPSSKPVPSKAAAATRRPAVGKKAARPGRTSPVTAAKARKTEAPAALPAATGDPQKDQALQSAEHDRLTARIADLKKQISAGEKSRSGAAAALARAERALSDVNHRLDELAQRQKATQELAASIDHQRVGTEGQIVAGQAAMMRTLTAWSANHDRDPLRTWLVGGNPNTAVRTGGYLQSIARAEAADLDALRSRVADLQARRQRADEDNRTLAQQADAQKSTREALASDHAAQRQALERLSQKLAEQRNTAGALEADEKRLSRVVEQLQRVIRQQALEESARRLAAKRLAEQQAAADTRKSKGSTRDTPSKPRERAPPARVEPEPDEVPGRGAFAQLRGQLRLPVRGAVTGRYGAPRGTSGASWKGVFVRTDAGADVHAVAAGKVIFADDLRGFGNLLIVDHGNQYLSIYANNDILLRRAGDAVQAGDVVSRAGNSSGDDQTGLYFELRFRGRPFDPLPWIGGR